MAHIGHVRNVTFSQHILDRTYWEKRFGKSSTGSMDAKEVQLVLIKYDNLFNSGEYGIIESLSPQRTKAHIRMHKGMKTHPLHLLNSISEPID